MAHASPSASDPRKSERFPTHFQVEFRSATGEKIEAKLKNVSRTGMCVEAPKLLDTGASTFFRVQVSPAPLQFHLQGEVIWSRKTPKTMGIRFVVSPSQSEKMLDGIVSVLSSASR